MQDSEFDEDMIGRLVRMTIANLILDHVKKVTINNSYYCISRSDDVLTNSQLHVVYDRLLKLEKLFYESAI